MITVSTQLLQAGEGDLHGERYGNGRVGGLLGTGTQGEVYAFDLERNDGRAPASLALKWYRSGYLVQDADLRERLANLIERGSPGPDFMWPLDLATRRNTTSKGFGYVMPRLESRFCTIKTLYNAADLPFRIVATAGYNLARSFTLLHASGLCYFDISDGNVCIDPKTGDVAILDCDNVTVNGGDSPVIGTPLFMAPELVRSGGNPRKETDLHSLAVLLFLLLVKDHPLLGKRETGIIDDSLWRRLFGTQPLFVFDPRDASNAPIPGHHENLLRNWPRYPQFLRELFTEAFTDGLADPRRRVGNSRWQAAMLRLRDGIYCPDCRAELIYEDPRGVDGSATVTCWKCGHAVKPPLRLTFERNDPPVVLNSNTVLTAHHTDELARWNISERTGAVQRSTFDPTVWGLKNLSKRDWRARLPDGTEATVPPERSVALLPGTHIIFDAAAARAKSATIVA